MKISVVEDDISSPEPSLNWTPSSPVNQCSNWTPRNRTENTLSVSGVYLGVFSPPNSVTIEP